MGAFAGRIPHLYEDQELTFYEVKDILLRLAEGALPFTEKFDGINIYFSLDPNSRSLLYCRNKGDFTNKGVLFEEFIQRYVGTNNEAIFKDFNTKITELVGSIPTGELKQIFENGTFYNTEILHPKFDSIIKYDTFKVIIQPTGHRGGLAEHVKFSESLEMLKAHKRDFLLINQIRTSKLTVNDKLDEVVNELRELLISENLRHTNTIGDLINKKMLEVASRTSLPAFKQKMLAKKLAGRKGVRVNNIYSGLGSSTVSELKSLIGQRKHFLREALSPLKAIIDNYHRLFLESYQPVIEASGELKSEGIVFVHENKTFKITGAYADMIRERNREYALPKKIAIIPGSFKPPHKEHLRMFEHYSKECDKVYVLVSTLPRKCSQGTEYTATQTQQALREFLKVRPLNNVIFIFDEHPHRKAISILNDPSEVLSESVVLIGASNKTGDHQKASYIYADRDDIKLLNTEETNYSMVEDLSSSDLREYLSKGQLDSVKSFIPEGVEVDNYIRIFGLQNTSEKKTKHSKSHSSLLDEVSGMGAAASVQGSSGGKKNSQYLIREEFLEELKLREGIRTVIKKIEESQLKEEDRLRFVIRRILSERQVSDVEPSPAKSTGINILEDLLKKIVPILETDYKKLTTSEEQRESFRAHVVKGLQNLLAPVEVNDDAGVGGETFDDEDKFIDVLGEDEIEEDIKVVVKDKKFIDVDKKEPSPEEKEEDELSSFTIAGKDLTGRNMAYDTFKRISTNVIDAYDVLSDQKDQDLFFDYLLTNVKLYFDKFEDELSPVVVEPTTDVYDQERANQEAL